MKIVVTGASGYIGNILVKELLIKGYKVTAIDNFRYDNRQIYQLADYENLKLLEGDVRDKYIQKAILEHDIIIPLAAIVGAPLCDRYPEDANSINFDSINKISKNKSSDQIIIYPTTNSGYGSTDGKSECDENSPLNPISIYGVTKSAAEKSVIDNDNFITFRLATVFGISPRMRVDLLVNNFVYKSLHEGCLTLFESHFIRNYIHIKDVARAFMYSIENYDKMKNDIYNLGLSDANLSKKELALLIKKYLPELAILEEEFTKDKDQRNYIVSNKKIEGVGFYPKYTIDDGIKELLKAFKILKQNQFGNI